MRRLTAALVLLALLLCGCVWSARSVERVCKNASDALRTGDLAAAHAIWEDAQPLLGALLPHEEIDETGLLFERLAAAETDNGDERRLDRAELLARLGHLPEMEKSTGRNIF